MRIELELWHLVLMLIAFFGCVAGFGKILLDQFEKRLNERFASHDATQAKSQEALSKNTEAIQALERDFLKQQTELALHYVRREDYVRGQTIIEAKIDSLHNKLEAILTKGAGHA